MGGGVIVRGGSIATSRDGTVQFRGSKPREAGSENDHQHGNRSERAKRDPIEDLFDVTSGSSGSVSIADCLVGSVAGAGSGLATR
jgi:hypothetical protein